DLAQRVAWPVAVAAGVRARGVAGRVEHGGADVDGFRPLWHPPAAVRAEALRDPAARPHAVRLSRPARAPGDRSARPRGHSPQGHAGLADRVMTRLAARSRAGA